MFENLSEVRDYTTSTLMRGVTDFGNLKQYNLYETGYSFLVCVSVPVFLEKLAKENKKYDILLNNYIHIIENEFRGIDGLENLTTETVELTNGISNINMISKVNEQSASNITMRYFEKAATPITRLHELYLKGIKDPRTQIKTYHGLIDKGILEPGYENEVFTFLYFVTDNSVSKIERAMLFLNAQPASAETSMFESEKGIIEVKEITTEFNCFPVVSDVINAKAKAYLDYMNNNTTTPLSKRLIKQSTEFDYSYTPNTANLPKGF